MNSWLLIFGLIAGVIGGMGMGGGTILVPLLTIFLSINQTTSQGINLICFFALASSSLFFHIKNKMVDFRYLLIIILCSAIFAIGGSFLAFLVSTNVLKICFGSFLIGLSILEFVQFFQKKSNKYS